LVNRRSTVDPRLKDNVRIPIARSGGSSKSDLPEPALSAFSQLSMTLIAAAVRHAITLESADGKRIIALFKRMLPRNLAALKQ
jgi:hypothetical protein